MSTVQKFTVVVLRLVGVWIGVRGVLGAVGLAGMMRGENGMMGSVARYGMATTLVTILAGILLFFAAAPIARLLTFDVD